MKKIFYDKRPNKYLKYYQKCSNTSRDKTSWLALIKNPPNSNVSGLLRVSSSLESWPISLESPSSINFQP